MPKPASTRPAYKMLTCIYLCRTLLFFAPYADFSQKNVVLQMPRRGSVIAASSGLVSQNRIRLKVRLQLPNELRISLKD